MLTYIIMQENFVSQNDLRKCVKYMKYSNIAFCENLIFATTKILMKNIFRKNVINTRNFAIRKNLFFAKTIL